MPQSHRAQRKSQVGLEHGASPSQHLRSRVNMAFLES
ncbi:hypothetical protein R69749_07228 [Paraburkholderia domus]|uniref:Uncharacterized protein n=1 Tax=Paraburkholderia domus TaxID=2793075 RepID=A0A9N8NFM9_9BURK|nr:hypothetical protein R70006_07219 [Paraburkholderia domus]CAE6884272.1 hypothetical protein R69749_07228 [Paraburkholderia domus]CAE6960010.1 hypothetical protein R70199_07246 [Paraburkholderia domus]CAE6964938.1 hypothetical protein R70211_07264 [Paraburkholderia domus]